MISTQPIHLFTCRFPFSLCFQGNGWRHSQSLQRTLFKLHVGAKYCGPVNCNSHSMVHPFPFSIMILSEISFKDENTQDYKKYIEFMLHGDIICPDSPLHIPLDERGIISICLSLLCKFNLEETMEKPYQTNGCLDLSEIVCCPLIKGGIWTDKQKTKPTENNRVTVVPHAKSPFTGKKLKLVSIEEFLCLVILTNFWFITQGLLGDVNGF